MREGIDCKNKKWIEIPRKGCKDMADQTYDYLTGCFRVTGDFVKDKSAWWLFKCKCGNEIVLKGTEVRYGRVHSCGCYKKQLMSNRNDSLQGKVFGKLLVLEPAGSNLYQKRLWKCQCSCGNIKYVTTGDLNSGHVFSCGCSNISKGELIIENILKENKIDFIHNKAYFKDLILFNGGIGRYDFILLNNGIPFRLIEFDGIQHFYPTSFYYGHSKENNFNYTLKNDQIKNKYAIDHNLPLVRIPYTQLKKLNINDLLGDNFLISNMEGVLSDE